VIIKGSLELGDDVLISAFGKFCVKEKGERRGRNPTTPRKITSVTEARTNHEYTRLDLMVVRKRKCRQ
jgi:nucleoid DNA-binding protein